MVYKGFGFKVPPLGEIMESGFNPDPLWALIPDSLFQLISDDAGLIRKLQRNDAEICEGLVWGVFLKFLGEGPVGGLHCAFIVKVFTLKSSRKKGDVSGLYQISVLCQNESGEVFGYHYVSYLLILLNAPFFLVLAFTSWTKVLLTCALSLVFLWPVRGLKPASQMWYKSGVTGCVWSGESPLFVVC